VKNPRDKLRGKRQRRSGERAHTTLADLLAVIDAATDDEEIDGIVGGLSSGKQAMLYSALHYTESRLHEPASAEQRKGNRLRALRILRELLL